MINDMKLFKYLDRINLIHKLLKSSNTGTPEELAARLGISRTSLYELIDELRYHNAPIAYSKSAKTFYYTEPFDITVTCLFQPLTIKEESEFSGGNFLSKILFFRTMDMEFSNVSFLC